MSLPAERGLFRQAALERLSTPDRLDELIEVTSPRSWLSLVAVVGLLAAVAAWGVYGSVSSVVRGEGMLIREGSLQTVDSPVSGKVDALFVRLGDDVEPGQLIARIIEPVTGGVTNVNSFEAGRVLEIRTTPGSPVAVGAAILSLERAGGPLEAVLYVGPSEVAKVHSGMEVQVAPASVKKEEFGLVLGHVSAVGTFPASRVSMEHALGNADVAAALAAAGPRNEVHVQLTSNSATLNGYLWTSTLGPPIVLANGTLCSADIVTEQQAPIQLLFARVQP